jgi:hypothetical protein
MEGKLVVFVGLDHSLSVQVTVKVVVKGNEFQ